MTERLVNLDGEQYPMSRSTAGQLVFADTGRPANRSDIAIRALGGAPQTLVGTAASEETPSVSPDGLHVR